jgi:hypothetical protein
MNRDGSKQTRWAIDATLFGGFLVACLLDLTGVALHQWMGVAVGALALYHFVAHWDWVAAVTSRLFGKAGRAARRFYVLDAGLLAGFSAIGISGLVISTWADLSLANYAAWRTAHVLFSVATLGLIVAKVALHWRWIAAGLRRPRPNLAPVTQSQPVAISTSRREFLKLMSVVGAAAVLAGISALRAEEGVEAQATIAQTTQSAAAQSATSKTTASSACVIRCGKRCSYPGRCRRYTDSNHNGRCDLGECIASS